MRISYTRSNLDRGYVSYCKYLVSHCHQTFAHMVILVYSYACQILFTIWRWAHSTGPFQEDVLIRPKSLTLVSPRSGRVGHERGGWSRRSTGGRPREVGEVS